MAKIEEEKGDTYIIAMNTDYGELRLRIIEIKENIASTLKRRNNHLCEFFVENGECSVKIFFLDGEETSRLCKPKNIDAETIREKLKITVEKKPFSFFEEGMATKYTHYTSKKLPVLGR